MSELRGRRETSTDAAPDPAQESPGAARQDELAPHPAASLHVFPRDPFKELAALRIPKRPRAMARGPAGQDPFRRRPDAFRTGESKPDPFAPQPPLIPPGEVYLDSDLAAPAGPSPAPASASAFAASAPPARPAGAAAPAAAGPDYYGRRGGGGGGEDPPKPKRFDQDDIAAAIMAILLLLALGWGAMGLVGGGDDPADERRLLPQSTGIDPAPVPAPAPDPFAGAPVDLTPRSAPPAVPSGDPAPVPEAASPQTALAAAPQPDTAAAPAVAPTCDPTRVLRAYFCTAKADLTPQSRAALEAQLTEMGSCADGREWVVKGFTDTRGAETFNTELAARRAARVAELLRAGGLTVSEVVGVGKLTDIEQGQNCANQRRVDVSLKTSIPPSNRACAPLPEEEALICP